MKISELYKREPESTSKCLGHLKGFYYDHIKELSDSLNIDSYYGLEDKNEKVEIKYYKDHCFDGRRTWTLASVWYDNSPIMVIQNAGREGDDHRVRFITNNKGYDEMLQYISSLIEFDNEVKNDLYNADDDIETLTRFYGHSLGENGNLY